MKYPDIEKQIFNDAIKKHVEAKFCFEKALADNAPVKIALYYKGFTIVKTNAITKEIQRRTHRKRRINKKWAKRYGYKTVPDDEIIIRQGSMIFATPNGVERIKKAINGGK